MASTTSTKDNLKGEKQSLIERHQSDVTALTSSGSLTDTEVDYSDESSCSSAGSAPKSTESSSWLVQRIKYTISLILLTLCVAVILAGIAATQTPVAQTASRLVALAAMWLLILWLGVLEGGQGSLVGLKPIDKDSYKDSHPIAHKCTLLAHEGDNLNRFIVGRQFLVVLVVFCLNLCCTPTEEEEPSDKSRIPFFPKVIDQVFLESGLAVMIITVILGQLSAEVNATNCMLDFINTPVVHVSTWICLLIEESGLLHSVYLVQWFFALTAKDDSPSSSSNDDQDAVKEEKQAQHGQEFTSFRQAALYWIRVLVSFAFVAYAMVVTFAALMNTQTTMYHTGLPNYASVVIFLCLIGFLGMLEAMQIALFAVVNLPEKALRRHPVAQANCELAFTGNNFQAFLIGRQMFVTFSMFLLARITTTDVDPDISPVTVLGMPPTLQNFFNTGLPGALITTVVASLAWRIIAACFPVEFMASPLVYITIQSCLLVEATGIFSAAWLMADGLKVATGLRNDEEYLGSMGQRGHSHGGHGKAEVDRAPLECSDGSDDSGIEFEEADAVRITGYGATTSQP
mmetsp:Transcript_9446/g.26091  ORF Transcript_9446/g.26091 Transcript_9446/m.26091 type:complete len:571 (+) Transcript_9446:234-1946(+)